MNFRPLLRRLWKSLRPFAILVAIGTPLKSAIVDWNWVPTGSMEPTIIPVEMVVVNKLAYGLRIPLTHQYVARWDEPARGDVVVFISPADEQRLVKRVVGLPGDVVEMREERLFINGTPLEYRPDPDAAEHRRLTHEPGDTRFATERLGGSTHSIMIVPSIPAARSFGPVTVPPDRFFVLGDNRDNSNDSRFIGSIERQRILGRASATLASFDLERFLLPRPSRFLAPIQ